MTPMPTTCREIEPDLVAVAAGEAERAAVAAVEAHVDGCASCRRTLEQYRAVEEMVSALRRAPQPEEDTTLARAQLESRLADLRSRAVSFGLFESPLGPILIARSTGSRRPPSWQRSVAADGRSVGLRPRSLPSSRT